MQEKTFNCWAQRCKSVIWVQESTFIVFLNGFGRFLTTFFEVLSTEATASKIAPTCRKTLLVAVFFLSYFGSILKWQLRFSKEHSKLDSLKPSVTFRIMEITAELARERSWRSCLAALFLTEARGLGRGWSRQYQLWVFGNCKLFWCAWIHKHNSEEWGPISEALTLWLLLQYQLANREQHLFQYNISNTLNHSW